MNFDFSEQQKTIQAEARRFLSQQCSNDLVRELMDDEQAFHHQELWRQVIELGWPALAISEGYGGLGLGYLELCLLSQELGRSLAPLPFSSSAYLYSETLKLFASSDQKHDSLKRIAAGSSIGCLAVTESIGKSIDALPEVTFDGSTVTGKKVAVVDGMSADQAVVSVRDELGKYCLVLVGLEHSSVTRELIKSLDPSRPIAELRFNGAPAQLIGAVGEGAKMLSSLYDRAAVMFAFEQIGGCEAALKMGIKYTKQRYAFGRQVASFQAIKHKFADMYVAKEIATANAYYAAWALSTNAPELPLAAATARVSAINAYFECSKENLQAHGGMGYTWEFDCHLHYRRAQHLSVNIGSAHFWKDRLSNQLLADSASSAQQGS